MKNIFRPDIILNNYKELDVDDLLLKGFKVLLLDIDNTIDIPDSLVEANKEVYDYISSIEEKGIKIIIVSNNTKKRVQAFIGNRNYDYYYWSFKPLSFVYWKILRKYKFHKKDIVCMGDQLITDCIGANLLGLYCVYTKQLMEKDSYTTVINRKIERFIFKHILHEEV